MAAPVSELFFILGHPVGHSVSPAMHNDAFGKQYPGYSYHAFDVSPGELEKVLQSLYVLGFRGGNLTVPFKEDVLPFLAEASRDAERLGAVNTLIRCSGGYRGENTDGTGFVRGLEKVFGESPAGRSFCVIGAGGAARGIVYALARGNAAEIRILNRTLGKAEKLAGEMGKYASGKISAGKLDCREDVGRYDYLVQTTSLGMDPRPEGCPEIDYGRLHPGQKAVDIVYSPADTVFLQKAREKGCLTDNGLTMLVEQGRLAYEIWTGTAPPEDFGKTAAGNGKEKGK